MSTEIERKYLVRHFPESMESYVHTSIRQGYLIATNSGLELRVRQKEKQFFQTIKMGEGLSRTEIEIKLSKEQFNELWAYTAGHRIRKIRYRIPIEEYIAELDVFDGDLAGLRLVEVEFPSVEASRQFIPPGWFGTEVTDDKRYKNKQLAVDGVPNPKEANDGSI